MNKFLVMWCNQGLESILDINEYLHKYEEWSKRETWRVLTETRTVEDIVPSNPLRNLILRAKLNSQRQYEIYTIETTDLSKEDLEQCFSDTPQMIVDLIREKGVKVYSDRIKEDNIVIR